MIVNIIFWTFVGAWCLFWLPFVLAAIFLRND